MDSTIREQLVPLVNKEVKYIDLCKGADLPKLGGNAKDKQLKELQLYCELEVSQFPTRYKIVKIYNDDEVMLKASKSEYQLPFEYIIARQLSGCEGNELYCTNTQLLTFLALVNENYKLIKSRYFREQLEEVTGEEYDGVYECASKAGRVLKKWADKMLRRMQARGLIFYRQGFCLTEEVQIDGLNIKRTINVPLQSDMEKAVMGCWADSLKELGIGNYNSGYIPPEFTGAFYRVLGSKVREVFGESYTGAYRVNVISICPTANNKFIQQAQSWLKVSEYKRVLNDLSMAKLEGTSELLDCTKRDIETTIKDIINLDTAVSYRAMVENKKEEAGK